ncbi:MULTISPECIES: DUF2271 domain-containing protein [Massilia]|uniref:DUF2271 domain-containing protein n=1 Tax=Massilia violaceinigra TaxID=2045208 RepID=A0A2D2DM61_9BURK|nr:MULTISPECIES: DUF2271 domain-containing protein [Massilia]ATQ76050.1 hypothetical protein CR152_17035 [Massilia violaceinigra]MDQ1814426.1 DUF2271 domain-containing protein [Massilia sp. CCM 9210]MDQ1832537.1 DUF2271 domain-containing protein [Massilia sp. CCM 9029]
MKLQHTLALTLPMLSSWAVGADLAVKFEIPQLNVAEYHRPYVAMWLERADQSVAANLSVLYDVKKKDNGGTKWVKDLRTWWRKAGRDVELPMDGVSGATRSAGEQTISFGPARTGIDKLPAGDYKLVIEAARESGGRELVRVPFTLPLKGKQTFSARGKEELGAVSLQITP